MSALNAYAPGMFPGDWQHRYLALIFGSEKVVPVDLVNPMLSNLQPSITLTQYVNATPFSLAISSNQLFALIGDGKFGVGDEASSLTVIDLRRPMRPTVGVTVSVAGAGTFGALQGIAITPDNLVAYAIVMASTGGDIVVPFDLSDLSSPVAQTPVLCNAEPSSVSISSDGSFAIITNYSLGKITPFSLASPLTPIAQASVSVATHLKGGAIAPNDTFALVCSNNGNSVWSIDLTNPLLPNIGGAVAVGSLPETIAIAPDNTFAVVANFGDNTISVLSLAVPLAPVVIATVSVDWKPIGVSYTSDGRIALVELMLQFPFQSGIVSVDMTNPSLPIVGRRVTFGDTNAVGQNGNFIFGH